MHQSLPRQIERAKAGRHFVDAARERDRLEALAHFARQRQAFRFADDAHAFDLVEIRDLLEQRRQAAREQELALRRIADELEAGARRRLRRPR